MLWELQALAQTWPSPRNTPRTTSPKNGIEKPWSQRSESLKWVDPRFLGNTCFAKKHTGRAWRRCRPTLHGHECTGRGCLSPRKPREVKPKFPEGSSHRLSWFAYIAHPRLRKRALAPRVSGSTSQRPRLKPRPRLLLSSQGSQTQQRLQNRGLSADVKRGGLLWPLAAIFVELVSSCAVLIELRQALPHKKIII